MKIIIKMLKNCIIEFVEKFFKWKIFIKFVVCLRYVIKFFKYRIYFCFGWYMCENSISV